MHAPSAECVTVVTTFAVATASCVPVANTAHIHMHQGAERQRLTCVPIAARQQVGAAVELAHLLPFAAFLFLPAQHGRGASLAAGLPAKKAECPAHAAASTPAYSAAPPRPLPRLKPPSLLPSDPPLPPPLPPPEPPLPPEPPPAPAPPSPPSTESIEPRPPRPPGRSRLIGVAGWGCPELFRSPMSRPPRPPGRTMLLAGSLPMGAVGSAAAGMSARPRPPGRSILPLLLLEAAASGKEGPRLAPFEGRSTSLRAPQSSRRSLTAGGIAARLPPPDGRSGDEGDGSEAPLPAPAAAARTGMASARRRAGSAAWP